MTSNDKRPKFSLLVACWLVFIVFKVLFATVRFRIVGNENREKATAMHPNGSFAFALWHNNLLSCIAGHASQNISPMISPSGDGELAAYVAKKLGLSPVRGSSSRDGEAARHELQARVRKGIHAAYAVDGPRGPKYKVKPGIIDISRKEQIPILPLAAVADRYWTLRKTWDQFRIPKFFSTVTIVYGEPYIIPAETQGLAFGKAKLELEERLLQLEPENSKRDV